MVSHTHASLEGNTRRQMTVLWKRCMRPGRVLLVGCLTSAMMISPVPAQERAGVGALQDALQLLDVLMPPGAVVAFNREQCPSGWREYLPARGRFVRGIDPAGERDPGGVREPGSVQQDAIQAHRHAADRSALPSLFDSTDGTGPQVRAAAPSYQNERGHVILDPTDSPEGGRVRTATETRPDNVALLYCERLR